MNVDIRCETFLRLASITAIPYESITGREALKTIFVEISDGNVIAVASNGPFMVVEYVGRTTEPDGSFNVYPVPELLAQCETEKQFDGVITFTANDLLKYTTAKTSFGFILNKNIGAFFSDEENIIRRWRDILPKKPAKETKGAMFWDVAGMAALVNASPSGKCTFPDYIDVRRAVIIRDIYNDNWFGAFLPVLFKDGKSVQVDPAIIPNWVVFK